MSQVTQHAYVAHAGISAALLSELSKLFPPRPFGPEDTLQAVMYYSGQQSVISTLAYLKDRADRHPPMESRNGA